MYPSGRSATSEEHADETSRLASTVKHFVRTRLVVLGGFSVGHPPFSDSTVVHAEWVTLAGKAVGLTPVQAAAHCGSSPSCPSIPSWSITCQCSHNCSSATR